jgi:hypothetical protein
LPKICRLLSNSLVWQLRRESKTESCKINCFCRVSAN